MIKRSPIRKVRSKPRRGQPTKAEKEVIRDQVYLESEGKCELRNNPKCIQGVLPKDGETPWDHWHLVHLKSKRVHGWGRDNLCGGCWVCHLIGLHTQGGNGKIVPLKSGGAEYED
jgi:hypothetical protein